MGGDGNWGFIWLWIELFGHVFNCELARPLDPEYNAELDGTRLWSGIGSRGYALLPYLGEAGISKILP